MGAGAQGEVHPKWSAHSLQGTCAHTNTLIQVYTTGKLEMPISLHYMFLACGWKPEYLEDTHEAHKEHATSTHTETKGEIRTMEVQGDNADHQATVPPRI